MKNAALSDLVHEHFGVLTSIIKTLRAQVECGCSGHVFAPSDISDGAIEVSGYYFKCIHCDIKYFRSAGCLTEHEQVLIKSMES